MLFMTIPGTRCLRITRAKEASMLTQVTVKSLRWSGIYGWCTAIRWLFGEGNHFFGNADGAMLKNIALTAVTGTIYQYIHVAFQDLSPVLPPSADCRRAGGAYSFSAVLILSWCIHAFFMRSDCAHGVGGEGLLAAHYWRAGFCRWYGGAY
ncbi:hypothetical protein KCP78_00865 [Salmonella enterica subsp. enterica]|nr:hypothetical protein KCP78_00865 [Salmonella enterica subsp. enterica]